jgi:histidinol-phosphate aminotransferase
MGNPSFAVYKLVTLLFGARPIEVPLVNHRHDLDALRAAVTSATKLVFVPSPNNPTGTTNTEAELFAFVRSLPDHVVFAYDEAYSEFLQNPPDLRPLIAEGRKVVCLRTFSKIYGLASLRVGYGYTDSVTASLLSRVRQPFNVNAIAQAAALAALDDEAFAQKTAEENRRGLVQLTNGFKQFGLEYVPSEANFLLVRVGDGAKVFDELQRRGVIVRPLRSYGMPEWLRITVGQAEQNTRFLRELGSILGLSPAGTPKN